MSGVSWDERKPTDWLASNGRWYPKSTYPLGWNRSSLPPAPDHGEPGSILRRLIGADTTPPEISPATAPASISTTQRQQRAGGQPPRPGSPPAPGFSVAQSGRSVADATVTAQRTHTPRVSPGAPPPPALPPTAPPPGRIRDDAPRTSPTPTTAVTPAAPPPDKSDLEVVAGDLGRVLGGAKKRIENALNDAARQQ